jgi:hypothetical protein
MRGRSGGGGWEISHPPKIPSYGITRDVRLRFLSNAAAQTSITYQNLLDTVLLATSATAGYDLYETVRVNAIEMWATSTVTTPCTVTVIFAGLTVGASGDQKTHTDSSMGIQPAHLKAVPDPLTQAGQFQPSTADAAFYLDVPTGTVIDVSMTLRQPIIGGSVAAQNALVAANVGAIYYRGLDGKAVATTVYPSVGAVATI